MKSNLIGLKLKKLLIAKFLKKAAVTLKWISHLLSLPLVPDVQSLHCVLPKVGLVTEAQHLAGVQPIPNIRSLSATFTA